MDRSDLRLFFLILKLAFLPIDQTGPDIKGIYHLKGTEQLTSLSLVQKPKET